MSARSPAPGPLRPSPDPARLVPLEPPPDPPARLTTEALPPYRHVPGLTPHPVTHPEGHLHGKGEWLVHPPGVDLPDDWRRCTPYLLGVDLFNRAYYWEAHEAWEVSWNAAGHDSPPGVFLQALVQASAALLQLHRKVPRGARTLARKADAKLAATASRLPRGEPLYMGLDVEAWREELRTALTGGPSPVLRLAGR